jgi:hypothetical protein
LEVGETGHREQRAQAIVEGLGREVKSTELKKLLEEKPFERPVCFEQIEDPSKIYVTCHKDANTQREDYTDDETTQKNYNQHKACEDCSRALKKCHMCRPEPSERVPLSKVWNGHQPLNMMMGGNPFLVDFSQ